MTLVETYNGARIYKLEPHWEYSYAIVFRDGYEMKSYTLNAARDIVDGHELIKAWERECKR